MNIYSDLAKSTVEEYLIKQNIPVVKKLPEELTKQKAGCFVSIHLKNNHELRGCIGTIIPVYKNLGGEIIANAIEAAFRDPRFEPITKPELDNLEYSVDVLSQPEAIKTEKELDPHKYGVIVKSMDGFRTGLLLPDLEGVQTVKQQVDIAREKAGIEPDEEIQLFRFSSTRHED